jgi:hypothetical protein
LQPIASPIFLAFRGNLFGWEPRGPLSEKTKLARLGPALKQGLHRDPQGDSHRTGVNSPKTHPPASRISASVGARPWQRQRRWNAPARNPSRLPHHSSANRLPGNSARAVEPEEARGLDGRRADRICQAAEQLQAEDRDFAARADHGVAARDDRRALCSVPIGFAFPKCSPAAPPLFWVDLPPGAFVARDLEAQARRSRRSTESCSRAPSTPRVRAMAAQHFGACVWPGSSKPSCGRRIWAGRAGWPRNAEARRGRGAWSGAGEFHCR